jgi:hypothetical protein
MSRPRARCLLPGARRLALTSVLALALVGSVAGCALVEPVAAWEKGMLAKPEMSFEGDRLDVLFQEHTYSSKEAASGGAGVGGGGCGCN